MNRILTCSCQCDFTNGSNYTSRFVDGCFEDVSIFLHLYRLEVETETSLVICFQMSSELVVSLFLQVFFLEKNTSCVSFLFFQTETTITNQQPTSPTNHWLCATPRRPKKPTYLLRNAAGALYLLRPAWCSLVFC